MQFLSQKRGKLYSFVFSIKWQIVFISYNSQMSVFHTSLFHPQRLKNIIVDLAYLISRKQNIFDDPLMGGI